MRQRQDFYTLCPGCDSKVELTLAAKLQAARAGCSCACPSENCKHEWVCIQEWIYRVEPIDHSKPVMAPNEHPPVTAPSQPSQEPFGQPQSGDFRQPPATTVAAAQPPRPHLPTYQPPQPIAPPAQQQPTQQQAAQTPQQPDSPPVPAPHAWSWERKTEQQPASPNDTQPGYGQRS